MGRAQSALPIFLATNYLSPPKQVSIKNKVTRSKGRMYFIMKIIWHKTAQVSLFFRIIDYASN